MKIIAYIDDSQSNVGDENFYLAGYFMASHEWERFSNEWRRTLSRSPSIRFLHMKEANAFKGEFKGWTRGARDLKLAELASVIEQYSPLAISCSLSRRFYKQHEHTVPYYFNHPYLLCFYKIIFTIGNYLNSREPDSVGELVFDHQGGLGEMVADFYDFISFRYPDQLRLINKKPTFADGEKVLPLQSSDMLAWYLRRRSENLDEELPNYDKITRYHNGYQLEQADIERVFKMISTTPGVGAISTKAGWRKAKKEMFR